MMPQEQSLVSRNWRAGAVLGLTLIRQIIAAGAMLGLLCATLILAPPQHPVSWFCFVFLIGLALLQLMIERGTRSPGFSTGMALFNFAALITFLGLASGGVASPFAAGLLLLPLAALNSAHSKMIYWGIALMLAGFVGLAMFANFGDVLFAGDFFALLPPYTVTLVLATALIFAAALSCKILVEHRRTLHQVRSSEAQFKVLADGSSDLLLHFGGDGRIRFASAAAREFFNTSASALEGRSLSEFVSGEDRRAVQRALARVNYFGADAALTFRLAGHDMRWIEMRCRPILRSADKAHTLRWAAKANDAAAFDTIGVLRDITALMSEMGTLKQARDEACEANAAKSRFLANMSHELRTPLNAIIGFSDMMMSELFGPLSNPRYAEYVRHIKQGGEHLRDLINDVLDMSKIEAGRFDLELETFSVPKLISDVLTTVSVTAGRKKIDLALEMEQDLPQLYADRRAVKQMLLNLLANAIKFTPPEGQVATWARREGAFLVLEVRDTGVGIPADDLSRLTQPFEQAAKLGSAGETGTGLGLALVRAMAELHAGSLTISSEEGKGTLVRIAVPFSGPHAGRPEAGAPVIRARAAAQISAREVA